MSGHGGDRTVEWGSLGIYQGQWLELRALPPTEDMFTFHGVTPPNGRATPPTPSARSSFHFGRLLTSGLTSEEA